MEGKIVRISMLLMALAVLSICVQAADNPTLKIATTTSLYDTKLLDLLQKTFEQENNVSLKIVSGGTGIAIQYGERGDVDMLMIHDKDREQKFIKDGHGLERRCFAYNYFTIVGPKDDPAGIKGLNATQALRAILTKGRADPSKVKFISRGDNSGTYTAEQRLWKKAGYNYSQQVNNSGPWYLESGQGMGATLMIADQKSAYTLSDISTFRAYQGNLTLVSLIESGNDLLNVYVAIALNPKKHPGVNCELANKFINFLVSKEGQDLIGSFGKEKYGKALFNPAVGNCTLIGCAGAECATPTNASCAAA